MLPFMAQPSAQQVVGLLLEIHPSFEFFSLRFFKSTSKTEKLDRRIFFDGLFSTFEKSALTVSCQRTGKVWRT